MQRRSVLPGALVAALACVVLIAPVAPATGQVSGLGVGLTPAVPGLVTVADQNRSAQLHFANNSFGAAAHESVTLSNVRFNLACATTSVDPAGASPCPTAEARPAPGSPILRPDPTSTAGTTCSGGPFSITGPDAEGDYTVVPTGTLLLAPAGTAGSSCIIAFTFDVVQRPLDGGTAVVAAARATSPSFAGGATATGASNVVVNRATAGLVTQASSNGQVPPGTTVTDMGSLVTPANGPGATGTITYVLVGPNPDLSCAGPVVASGTAPVGSLSPPFTPVVPGTYNFVATYSGDANYQAVSTPVGCGDPKERFAVSDPTRYTPLSPARIEDTRLGVGGLHGPLGPGQTVEIQVGGRGGVPAGATAVVLNVTVTQPTADGYLTIYPGGSPRPVASNLNFTPGKTVPNLVVVKLGAGGRVAMFNSAGSTDVVYDVTGYFTFAAGPAGRFQPLVPARIADSRVPSFGTARLGPGQSIDVQVSGRGGAPASGVSAAVLNVTATNATAVSYLTVYPAGESRPLASNLNVVAGDTVANRALTRVGVGGRVTIYNNSGTTDVVVDLGGWFTDGTVTGTDGSYAPLEPARIVDTRTGTGAPPGAVPAGGTIEIQVTGRGGVPATGVRAVVLNVTATQPASGGWFSLYPSGATQPNSSDLNFAAGETRPNLVVVQVGTDGRARLFASAQSHAIVDVAGYFT